jgi:N-acetylmuramoyl-L-alanine amidase
MRKIAVVLAAFVLFPALSYTAEIKAPEQKGPGGSAGPVTDVTFRFSKHEGFSRIVFETAAEPFIQNTSVASNQSQIKVQFPSDISLKGQAVPDISASLRGKVYTMDINYPFRIKVLKLSSPPRLSIDIITIAKEENQKRAAVEAATESSTRVRIVLDPGHGGYDLGLLSGELREKDVTFSLARGLEAALIKKNRVVYLTRKADQFLSITDRALFANQKAPEVFISLHLSLSDEFVIYTSSSEQDSGSVSELYSITSRQRHFIEKSLTLAEVLGKILKEDFKKEVILRKMDLPLLASVGAASVMVEVPMTAVTDQAAKTRISESLLKGIVSYAFQ